MTPARKTRTTLALAVLSLCLLPAASNNLDKPSPSPSPNATVPGRYQLTPAVIDTEPTIFRLDTATGQTWQLIGVPATIAGHDGHVNGWQPGPENPWTAAAALREPNKTASTAPHTTASH